MLYGQLGSRWPIVCSPVVADGKVVVSAGLYEKLGGVHVVCADAVSGQILWEQSDWTASESNRSICGAGQFAFGTELFWKGGKTVAIRINPKDGGCRPVFPETAGVRWQTGEKNRIFLEKGFKSVSSKIYGQDIGVFSKEWIVYGGRIIWGEQARNSDTGGTIKFLGRENDGGGRLPVISVSDVISLPVWDERDVAFIYDKRGKGTKGIALIPRNKFLQALDALMVGKTAADFFALDSNSTKGFKSYSFSKDLKAGGEGLPVWKSDFPYGRLVFDCVLTKNAVLVTSQPRKEAVQLTALNRADGQKMWDINLPATPVRNGIAVSNNGSIILTLVDGGTLCIKAEK
jgi:outer membrane protein assembly factor BamB